MFAQPSTESAQRNVATMASGTALNPFRARALAGLPVEVRQLDVNGVRTSVLISGQGAPLLLLHGGIECGGVYWAPVLSQLAARYRIIVPDAPGLGESAPIDDFHEDAFGNWLSSLIALTCQEPPALVAHSLLGTFAARYAAQDKRALRSLVICGAPGVARYRMPLGLIITAVRFELRPTYHNRERFESYALLDRPHTRQRDAEWFDAFSRYAYARALVPHVRQTMRQLIKRGTRQIPESLLRDIAIPISLLWGRHDRFVPLRVAHEAHARLGWPLRIVETAAHVPHMEQPEAFLEALRDFV